MKIKQHIIEQNSIGDFKEIKSTIANKDLGLALKMVSKNLYSDPIGSFIRELVANGVDANIEAGIENPILIRLYREESMYYISFKDNGTGISPEKFESMYMSWFNSDKRDNDIQIGGWGLGSKSPLAYQDSFEINTIYNGNKYYYILANDAEIPTATLLNQHTTEEPNGTEIIVEIKSEDTWKVSSALTKQLYYFKSVYVKNEIYYYDNYFKIYNEDLYYFRIANHPFGNELHICREQVAYPINWKLLNMEPIKIPLGVKFTNEELEVTLSREEISYTPETKENLIRKINLIKERLDKLFIETKEKEDLFEFIKVNIKDSKKINIHGILFDYDIKDYKLIFKPLNLEINKKHIYHLLDRYDIEYLRNSKTEYADITRIININSDFKDVYYLSTRYNYYHNLYIGSGFIIRKKPKSKYNLSNIKKLVSPQKNRFLKINTIIKYIDKYIEDNCKPYECAPPEWIEEERERVKQEQEDRKGLITYYNINNNKNKEPITMGELFDTYKYIFYIDKNDDKDKICHYTALFNTLPSYFKKNIKFIIVTKTTIKKLSRYKRFMYCKKVFKIPQLRKHFRKIYLSNMFTGVSFTYLYNMSKYYYNNYLKYSGYIMDIKLVYFDVPYYINHNGENIKYTKNFNINIYEYFKNDINPIISNTVLQYEYLMLEYLKFYEKFELFNYLESRILNYSTDANLEVLRKFVIKLRILKLNPKYYVNN